MLDKGHQILPRRRLRKWSRRASEGQLELVAYADAELVQLVLEFGPVTVAVEKRLRAEVSVLVFCPADPAIAERVFDAGAERETRLPLVIPHHLFAGACIFGAPPRSAAMAGVPSESVAIKNAIDLKDFCIVRPPS